MIHVFIPVRGGSKSIPFKNIKMIAGKPLVQWVIDVAKQVERVDNIVVSTDSHDIRECLKKYNNDSVSIIGRSEESSVDTAPSEIPLLEFCKTCDDDDIVVFIQATSPLLKAEEVNEGINILDTEEYDSCLSVVRQKRFVWNRVKYAHPDYDLANRPRRQEQNGFFVENGAFYISKVKDILHSGCRVSGRIGLIECSEESYYEIDEKYDFLIVENMLINKLNSKKYGKDIKMFITDVDGTLTDGKVLINDQGLSSKAFNIKDGMGVSLLKEKGIKVAAITGSKDDSIKHRLLNLGIDDVYYDCHDKEVAVKELCKKHDIKLENVAYIGDDINDISAMSIVGLSFCPSDSVDSVKKYCNIVNSKGGSGAVRESIDIILTL